MSNNISFLLIGGGGFIGKALSDFLDRKGFDVTAILRGQISNAANDHSLKDKSYYNLLLENAKFNKNVVIDLAYTSVPGTSFSDPVKDFSENLYNVISHLEFARQLPNVTYVYISSGGTVYGNSAVTLPIKESSANNPLSPYGITKLACEKYVLMYKEVYGMDVRIVRPSNVYGNGQLPFRGQGFIATAIAKILGGETIQIFGDGGAIRDYLHVDDFSSAVMDVITYGSNGEVYNVGSGIGLSINEVLSEIGNHITGYPVNVDFLPLRPFDVAYNVLDNKKISEINSWQPSIAFPQGLSSTIAWIHTFLNKQS